MDLDRLELEGGLVPSDELSNVLVHINPVGLGARPSHFRVYLRLVSAAEAIVSSMIRLDPPLSFRDVPGSDEFPEGTVSEILSLAGRAIASASSIVMRINEVSTDDLLVEVFCVVNGVQLTGTVQVSALNGLVVVAPDEE
jgi:hypothetical protein